MLVTVLWVAAVGVSIKLESATVAFFSMVAAPAAVALQQKAKATRSTRR